MRSRQAGAMIESSRSAGWTEPRVTRVVSGVMILFRALRTAAWALATVTAGATAFHAALAAPSDAREPLRPGTHKVLVDQRVSGIRRSYYVHVPAGDDGTTPLPVVVALHGAFSTARKFERESGFSLRQGKKDES